MRPPQIYTSWLVTCRSPDGCRALRDWLTSRIDLERVLTETVRSFPGGVELVESRRHRLGDYFAAVRVHPASADAPSSFRVVFQRLPQAERFWKDLMVTVLQEIETAPEKASIVLDYKGDEAPPPTAIHC